MTNMRDRILADVTSPQKSVELWTFDELVNWACVYIIETIVTNPTELKSVIWRVVDIAARWQRGKTGIATQPCPACGHASHIGRCQVLVGQREGQCTCDMRS